MNKHFYSQDEVQQIVKRAVTIQEVEAVSVHQLGQIAAELGISPEALERAQEQWRTEQSRRGHWANLLWSGKALSVHFWAYAVSNAILGINIHYSEMNPALWSIPVIWAVGVLCHGRASVLHRRHPLPRRDSDRPNPALHRTPPATISGT